MSLVRLLRPGTHAVADYMAAITVLLTALVIDGPTSAKTFGVVIGVIYLIVSAMTRYPLGLVKVLPFPVHAAGDYVLGLALILGPFVGGFYDDNKGASIAYILSGVAVIGVSMITDYQYSRRDDSYAVEDNTNIRTRARV
jgi:hypothetical protein